jgi:hypothetical protein
MNPRQVVTRGESFARLGKALLEWKKSTRNVQPDFFAAVENAGGDQPALRSLRSNLGAPFFTHTAGQVTVREFLKEFDPTAIRPSEETPFREALHHAVAACIRDHFMAQQAASQDLENHPALQRNLKAWQDKWVYEQARRHLVGQPDTSAASAARVDHKSLIKHLAELRKKYPVRINRAVLDTLAVSDFEKSKWAMVQVFKSGTGRPAVPVVDPAWGAN